MGDIAQTIKDYWKKPFQVSGKGSSVHLTPHEFGWRDMMDIALRWRQHSEYNDPVFWIDGIKTESAEVGFTLQTPIIRGQMKINKYYPYFDRCFGLLTKLLPIERGDLSKEKKKLIKKCKTVNEIWNILGEDFYVITPCHPRCGSNIMEGTRLTVEKLKYGHLFTIRTPGIPGRRNQYDNELKMVFNELAKNAKQRSQKNDLEKSVELSLICYFYWVNFGALTRGTAATGMIILHALIIANGYLVTDPIPRGMQIDWEAITTPTHTEFVKYVRPWLNVIPLSQDDSDMPLDKLPKISEHVKTMRDMLMILNDPWRRSF